ncbi:hypothetical protein [Brunnivagina elsteri]|uniref:Uncharacterized protein n=1 Tax=Brunnivagina elsteri CCALA 953 TaxID=987040 RepID=A0A2A2TL83_9CYAN|nr:hypothetical protein [Calothrix elsteri]PAX58361.1 hypothetical protein CK510_07780 [Calothrix elsteri CCALA 953]
MGAADIVVQALESKIVRQKIGDYGKRVLKVKFEDRRTLTGNEQEGNGALALDWIWNQGERLIGFLLEKGAELIKFTFVTLWGLFVSTTQFIWNFDWNASDATLEQQINAKWDALGGMLGGTAGNLFGWIGCGLVPGALMLAVNEPLAAYIIQNVLEEMGEEVLANLAQLTNYMLQSTLQNLIVYSYINARKIIKANVGWVSLLFGDKLGQAALAWGNENSKPWSFASATEQFTESLPLGGLQNFVEEFAEEAWDGCVEAGYVVANSIDSFFAMEKLKQQKVPELGKTKYLEVTPNRENKEQRIILAGPQELVKQQVIATLADYQLMADKDVGVVYNFEPEKALNRTYKPHIILYFRESKEDFLARRKLDKKAWRGEGRISFRLMDKSTETITLDYVTQLANKIKAKFGNPPLQWNKGKLLYSYSDWEKGYQLKLLVNSESEALRMIEQILDLQSHSVDREKIQQSRNLLPEKAYDETPKKKTVLGKPIEPPVKRKEVKIKFIYSQLFLDGNLHPVTLYDRSKRFKDAIVRDNT